MLTGGPQKESIEAARTLPPRSRYTLFFTWDIAQKLTGESRFHPDSRKASIFQSIWFRPKIFEAIKYLNKLSADSGITPTELSLRWIAHVSNDPWLNR